jgi:hypothetical protein
MLDTFRIFATVVTVVALPLTALAVLLSVVGWLERAREARIARQVGVTDAIHRQLGAVVAPVVTRRIGRGWRVAIAVPFESPAIVGRVVALAHAAMLRDGPSRFDIVLTTQTWTAPPIRMPERSRPGTLPLVASEREVMAWTGTSTSRAS